MCDDRMEALVIIKYYQSQVVQQFVFPYKTVEK